MSLPYIPIITDAHAVSREAIGRKALAGEDGGGAKSLVTGFSRILGSHHRSGTGDHLWRQQHGDRLCLNVGHHIA